MMDGTFVKEFKGALATPAMVTVSGKERLLAPMGYADCTPRQETVTPLAVHTLTGLVDYVRENRDGLMLGACLVHVLDHARVDLLNVLEDEQADFRRRTFLRAGTELVGGEAFRFGQYLDAESFFVGLQSCFVATPQREEILRLVASIRENQVRETVDSGVSQEVKTAGGVVLVGATTVPNPVTLQPYRTFREIEQPASLFVLRLKAAPAGDKPLCALFEADGSAWKLAAIQAIATYLAAQIGSLVAIIA